jgi:hypothetical protein
MFGAVHPKPDRPPRSMSQFSTFETCRDVRVESVVRSKADVTRLRDVSGVEDNFELPIHSPVMIGGSVNLQENL